MLSLAIKWIINAGAVFFVGRFLSGIHVPDVMTAVWVALALGIINTFIRPILKLLTFPITLLTSEPEPDGSAVDPMH